MVKLCVCVKDCGHSDRLKPFFLKNLSVLSKLAEYLKKLHHSVLAECLVNHLKFEWCLAETMLK